MELISAICSFLNRSDVGRLRRVNKFYANVGRPFIYRVLHFMFTPDSFARLHAISSNPELAPHVNLLYYEADDLPRFESMGDWEQHVIDSENFSDPEFMDWPGLDSSSKYAYRADGWELDQFPELKSTHYQNFLNHSKQQDAMRDDSYNAGRIADAMSNLPNLERIIFSLEHWEKKPSKAIKIAYSDSLVVPFGHNRWTEPRGVPQMLSLLQGSARTQVKLKGLYGGVIDWKFFKQSDAVLKDLQKAVQSVQELELEFSTSPGFEEALDHHALFGSDDLESEIRECAGCLQDGRLKDILAAAPNLERLDLKFDSAIPNEIRGCPADLSYVVGKHKWEFLADVTLSFLSSRAEDLVGFCETHAMTLEILAISRIILTEGSWLSTFQQMRRLLHLKEVKIRDRLEAFDERWNFVWHKNRGETTMSRVVQEYILQGGDGPLLDLNQYVDLNRAELAELKDLRSLLDSP